MALIRGSCSWPKRRVLWACAIADFQNEEGRGRPAAGAPRRPRVGVRGYEPPDLPQAAAAAGVSGASCCHARLQRPRRGGEAGVWAATAGQRGAACAPPPAALSQPRHRAHNHCPAISPGPASVRRAGLRCCPTRPRARRVCGVTRGRLPHPLHPRTRGRTAVAVKERARSRRLRAASGCNSELIVHPVSERPRGTCWRRPDLSAPRAARPQRHRPSERASERQSTEAGSPCR